MTTTAAGLGRLDPPHFAHIPWARLAGPGTHGDETAMQLAHDLYFGDMPPTPVEIPFSWLRPPIRVRQDNPYTIAEVSAAGATARAQPATPPAREWRFSASLDTLSQSDGQSLAQWVIDTYDISRPRLRDLTLRLNGRAEVELHRIMQISVGTRITLTDLPTGYPDGAAELVVEGIRHQMDAEVRDVILTAVPLAGAEPGESGPWFRLNDTVLGDADALLPF